MIFSRRPLLVAAALTAAAIAFTLALRPRLAETSGEARSPCLPDACFCEAPRAAAIRQPADTWSNLAYVTVGGLLLGAGGAQAAAFGLLCVLLGLGSGWFHATLTARGEWADVWCMFAAVGFLAARNLRRLEWVGPGGQAAVFAGIGAAAAWVVSRTLGEEWPFATLVVLFVATEVRAWRLKTPEETRKFLAAVGCFLAAFFIWILDITRVACSPRSLWQGHAAWHVLCAVSLLLLAPAPEPAGAFALARERLFPGGLDVTGGSGLVQDE